MEIVKGIKSVISTVIDNEVEYEVHDHPSGDRSYNLTYEDFKKSIKFMGITIKSKRQVTNTDYTFDESCKDRNVGFNKSK